MGAEIAFEDWWAYTRWAIARATGWTLDYIESLSFEALYEYLSVLDGEAKAAQSRARAKGHKGGGGTSKRRRR